MKDARLRAYVCVFVCMGGGLTWCKEKGFATRLEPKELNGNNSIAILVGGGGGGGGSGAKAFK